jgi:hypothetical protein
VAGPEPRELRDDPTIAGDVQLLRQVNPKRQASCVDWSTVDDDGRPRLRAGAFQRASKAIAVKYGYPERTLSLYLEDVIIQEFGSVEQWASRERPGWGVVRVSAAVLRKSGGFLLERDDLDGRVGHAVAWAGGPEKEAESAQKALSLVALWVVPPDVEASE